MLASTVNFAQLFVSVTQIIQRDGLALPVANFLRDFVTLLV